MTSTGRTVRKCFDHKRKKNVAIQEVFVVLLKSPTCEEVNIFNFCFILKFLKRRNLQKLLERSRIKLD